MAVTSYDPPRPIKGWTVQATCPECGHLLAHHADGRPDGTTTAAVAACTRCGRIWHAELRLIEVTREVAR